MPRGQGVYQVSGASSIWLLENNEWHWAPTQDSFFAWGYSWADVQVIDLATFCQYPIGQRLTDDGSAFTGSRGYIPSSDRAALDCSKVVPPEPTPPPEEPTPPAPTEPPPTGFIPRILYNAPSGYAPAAAAIGINVFLYNDFSRKTWASRESILKKCAQYGIKLMPWMAGVGSYDDPNIDPGKTFWENWWDGKRQFVEKYRNDDRIYGWYLVDEPDLGDKDPDPSLEELYNWVRKYDPGGKPCFITWDQWDAHGYRCKSGQFDIFTFDTYDSGIADTEKFKERFLRLNKYYHWIEIGKPAIAHFYKYEALEASFRAWQELVPAGVIGTMYYNAGIVMANSSMKATIKAFHQSMGWSPALVYTCPHCGATFSSQANLDGHIASEHPTEVFTTEEVTCSGCGALLELTISSIAEKNVSRSCPVCGTLAD